MDKRIFSLICAVIIGVFMLAMLIFAIKNIKIDDFHPAGIVFVVDSSASNQKELPEQKEFIRNVCNRLDPEDLVKVIRVSEDAYLIYEGAPNNKAIMKSMEKFTKFEAKEVGTAYGDGINKAIVFAEDFHKVQRTPMIIVIGDLENEGNSKKQLNWNELPNKIKKLKNEVPEVALGFFFAHPQKLDSIKTNINPILGEDKLILSSEENVDKTIMRILKAINR